MTRRLPYSYSVFYAATYTLYSLSICCNGKLCCLPGRLDEEAPNTKPHSLYQTVLEAFGASMMVLCLLDFGRLFTGKALQIPGEQWLYLYEKVQ